MTTQLGLACLASSLSPDEGLRALLELKQARKCFVLENELHLVYLVVPIYAAVSWPNLDWMSYLSLWETLPSDVKRVGELVGVEERFLVRAMRGTISTKTERQVRNSVCELFSVHVLFCYDFSHLCALQARQLAVHQRFYTALALHDLVNEVPLGVVSQKYGATKGTSNAALFEKKVLLQNFSNISLSRDAAKLTASRLHFCRYDNGVLSQVGLAQPGTIAGTVSGMR